MLTNRERIRERARVESQIGLGSIEKDPSLNFHALENTRATVD